MIKRKTTFFFENKIYFHGYCDEILNFRKIENIFKKENILKLIYILFKIFNYEFNKYLLIFCLSYDIINIIDIEYGGHK